MIKKLCVVLAILILVGCDKNRAPRYGPNGLPDNCRALIADGIKGYQTGRWSAEDVLDSINRNCGEHGYLW